MNEKANAREKERRGRTKEKETEEQRQRWIEEQRRRPTDEVCVYQPGAQFSPMIPKLHILIQHISYQAMRKDQWRLSIGHRHPLKVKRLSAIAEQASRRPPTVPSAHPW